MGEFGCGKSTLGRTLLQFYKQTDGRTMYYSCNAEDFAPAYVKRTLQNLEKRRSKYQELQAAYQTMDEKQQYAEKERLDRAVKEARDSSLAQKRAVRDAAKLKETEAEITAIEKGLQEIKGRIEALRKPCAGQPELAANRNCQKPVITSWRFRIR